MWFITLPISTNQFRYIRILIKGKNKIRLADGLSYNPGIHSGGWKMQKSESAVGTTSLRAAKFPEPDMHRTYRHSLCWCTAGPLEWIPGL